MTWSYDTALIADKDKVRLLVGDTDTNDQLLQDEEIVFILTQETNVYNAAALAARTIQSSYARKADVSVESVSKKFSQQAMAYAKLSEDLMRRAEQEDLVSPSVLGVSIDVMQEAREDTDRVKPKFEMNKFNNPPVNDPEDYDYDA